MIRFTKYDIKVTRNDIKRGERRSTDACPIALAIKRKIKSKCFVTSEGISIENYRELIYVSTAIDFLNRFDNRLKVRPFTFKIQMEPSKYLKQ